MTEPGARAKKAQARHRLYEDIAKLFRQWADPHGRVPLTAVLTVLYVQLDARYEQGYHAGLVTGQKRARMMRLTKSREALNEFLGSKFGKGFMLGQLSPRALSEFEFGGRR